mmetsp:Transcript_18325/g.29673  ORF Transcript_18325/g.29673 Transcript_18325/m.29673 type:complete len:221 (+) Transcript_18325:342-1004(+)
MCVSGESSSRASPTMPAPTTREEERVQSLRSELAEEGPMPPRELTLARERAPEESTRLCLCCCAPERASSAIGPSSGNCNVPSCCWEVNSFTAPSSSFTLVSNPRHRSAVSLLLSVLASAHSCNATTFASSPSTYSLSLLAISTTSIPSAALLFASTALWVTRLISSCISSTMASFSRRPRRACSVSIRDMRSSSWRLVMAFLAEVCSLRDARCICSRLL